MIIVNELGQNKVIRSCFDFVSFISRHFVPFVSFDVSEKSRPFRETATPWLLLYCASIVHLGHRLYGLTVSS